MKRSNGDYFGTKVVRGSSPTASLAADLSQNFHIDQRFAMIFLQLLSSIIGAAKERLLTQRFQPPGCYATTVFVLCLPTGKWKQTW